MLLETRRRPFAYAIAMIVAAAVVLLGISVPLSATAAPAQSHGVTLDVSYGGDAYDGHTVVEPGKTYEATIQYDLSSGELQKGDTVTIAVPDGVVFPDGVPSGNGAISEIHQDGDQLTLTFGGDFGNNQGGIVLKFQIEEPTSGSDIEELTWTIAGEETSQTVIVKKPGDEFKPEITAGLQKGVGGHELNGAVSYNTSNNTVAVADRVTDVDVPYTLTVRSTDARTAAVADTISDYLAYDEGSFTASLVSWDENGMNKKKEDVALPAGQPTFDGQSFTIAGLDLPEQSVLEIRYVAHVRADRIAALRDALQAKFDAIDPAAGGTYSVALPNEATLDGGAAKKGSTTIGSNRAADPQPDRGNAYAKKVDVTGDQVVEHDEDGTLAKAIDVTYTLTADLTKYADFADGPYGLKNNVVIKDTPDQQKAIQLDEDGVTATVNGAPFTLTETTGAPSEEEFSGDAYVGQYFWAKSGETQQLWINIGQDVTQKWSITLPGQIVSVAGAAAQGTSPTQAEKDKVSNVALFNDRGFGKGDVRKWADTFMVVPQPDGSDITDDAKFDKAVGDLPKMEIGKAYRVPFTFRIAKDAVVDLAESRIVDTVDHEVFDVSEANLDAIAETISATYGGTSLTGADFELSLVDDELVIELTDAAKERLGASPLKDRLELTLQLPTYKVAGKETIDITNKARVEGGTTNEWVWHNDATGRATSYGDELEVKKEVYRESDGTWTQNLRVPLDEDGQPTETDFVYRVQVLPHGSYAGTFGILDITDVLPDGVKLVGLVTDENVEDGVTRPETEVDIDGNLHASADLETGKVVLSQKSGTKISGDAHINFKVQLTNAKPDIGIVNKIGTTQAVITPSDGFPLLIQKADSVRDDVVITDRKARFTITGPDGTVITDAAYVVDGQLMVADAEGDDSGIVIPEAEKTDENPDGVPFGDYTVVETKAPAGYELPEDEAARTVIATIGKDGSSRAVTIYDDPKGTYAIGDYTWIDQNRDGIQGGEEKALAGVTVSLLDGDGDPVLDEDGEPLTTTSDERGFYLFDLLPAGEYKVKFELTAEQAREYTFTKTLQGDDVKKDSDAGADGITGAITLGEDNTQLVDGKDYADGAVKALYGIDPTWDAGVVQKSYAIGDHTWIDQNRDGIQDDDEKALPGVKVSLTDADGLEVTDLDGDVVAAVETDENGRYLFDNLPAGDYRVTFTLTGGQSETYVFTSTDAATDDANADSDADSDAEVSEGDQAVGSTEVIALGDDNAELVSRADDGDGETVEATEGIDPTWDAGVVERSYAVGDVVWIDADRNGLQDDGSENVLPGVTVEIADADGDLVTDVHGDEVKPVTTDENGAYLFDELPAGEYRVTFTLTEEQLAEYRFTRQDAETDDANADSDADEKTGVTTTIVLGRDNAQLTKDHDPSVEATEGIDPTWDAGVVHRTYAVGDYTWIDRNRDGVQGDDEEILSGVTVALLDGDGEPVLGEDGEPLTTVTDEEGRYLFDELPAGEYRLTFTLTPDQAKAYTFTSADAGDEENPDAAEERDSDAARGTGLTAVFLLDGSHASLVDGADYEFGDVTATEGIDPTWDAGVVEKTYAIGDYAWIDTDRDGVQDAGEDALSGVTVELIDPETGDAIDETATDDEGRYLFDGLSAGEYQVRFTLTDGQKKIYVFTTLGDGGATDSDASVGGDSAVGTTRTIVLGDDSPFLTLDDDRDLSATEGIDPTWDAGVTLASVSVGDDVWFDKNHDGRQDKGEPGIEGVCLTIVGPGGKPVTDVYGNEVGTARTDENGAYSFDDLPVLQEGEHYTVSVSCVPDGYEPTRAGVGDREGDSSTGSATSEGLTVDSERDATLDFGFFIPEGSGAVPPSEDQGTEKGDATDEPQAPAGQNDDGTDDGLAVTGGQVSLMAGAAALLLLLAGGAMAFAARRRRAAQGR